MECFLSAPALWRKPLSRSVEHRLCRTVPLVRPVGAQGRSQSSRVVATAVSHFDESVEDRGPSLEVVALPELKDLIEDTDKPTRRVLTCDGGGLRGLIGAETLAKLEEDLQKHYGDPDYRLGHFFDLVAGTSTGGIMAAWIACGWSMRDLISFYYANATTIFSPAWQSRVPLFGNFLSRITTKYSGDGIRRVLQEKVGELVMDSEMVDKNGKKVFLCDFMVVTKNFNTSRDWFIYTGKESPNYETTRHLKVKHAIAATAAAPTFLPPVEMIINGVRGEYVDGGISNFNNPAFKVLVDCIRPGYSYEFSPKADKLLLMSMGTGYSTHRVPFGDVQGFTALGWAQNLIPSLMNDSQLNQARLMKLITYDPNTFDYKELKAVKGAPDFNNMPGEVHMATYYRYGVLLSAPRLRSLLGDAKWRQMCRSISNARDEKESQTETLEKLGQMDRTEREVLQAWTDIGKAVAKEQYFFEQIKPFLPEEQVEPTLPARAAVSAS
mmetsp:Transcript_5605/g.13674  ORF Transcript_5605/g.13674 Transcript_5605/m.13674 type:complete len:495 (+) Transcript_5605:93-1577(+)